MPKMVLGPALMVMVAAGSGCAASEPRGASGASISAAESRGIWTDGIPETTPGRDDHGGLERSPGSYPPLTAAELSPAGVDGWIAIGSSVEGRPIHATTIGVGPAVDGPRVLVIGSIHGTEREGLAVIDRLVEHLRAQPVAAAVRVIRDMNPDGSAARTRGNTRGVDLNRNWPAGSFTAGAERGERPLSEPEALAVWRDIERWKPTLVVVLHSTASGPYVNYDGPAVEAATLFAGAAAEHDPRWRVVADMGYPTPGSLGSMMGVDRLVPILTIEFDRGQGEASVWAALRDGVGAVCGG